MKKSKKLNVRRTFSEGFKRTIVQEFESGKFSVLELSQIHHIGFQSIYKWVRKYGSVPHPKSVIVEMKQSTTHKLKQLEKRIKDLEQIVGQKQIQIDFLEKVIDLGNQHYKTDLKKNSSTKP